MTYSPSPTTELVPRATVLSPVANRYVTLVLGMHRSGTSALTRVLNLLGASLPENLIPPDRIQSPQGFWESQELVDLHESLLVALKSSWDDMLPFNEQALLSPALLPHRGQMSQWLAREMEHKPLLVLKDPRLCRLLPLWRALLVEQAAQPLSVMVVRNPLEVAASLQKRNGFPTAKSCLLWLRHVLAAEKHSRHLPRSIVFYADLLEDWRRVVGQIEQDLGVNWFYDSPQTQWEIDRFLSTAERHHVVSETALSRRRDLADLIFETYDALAKMAVAADPTAQQQRLDEIAGRLAQADQTYGLVLFDVQQARLEDHQKLAALVQQNQAIEQKLSTKAKSFDALQNQWKREAAESQQVKTRLQKVLDELSHSTTQHQAREAALSFQIGELQHRIDQMQNALAQKTQAWQLAESQNTALRHQIETTTTELAEVIVQNGQLQSEAIALQRGVQQGEATVATQRAQIEQLEGTVATQLVQIEALEATLAEEKDQMMARLAQQQKHIKQQEQKQSQLMTTVAELKGHLATQELQTQLQNQQINAIYRSLSWRLTAWPRSLVEQLLYLGRCAGAASLGQLRNFRREQRLVGLFRKSPWFDPVYYLSRYHDIKMAHEQAGLDPILHFVQSGVHEYRAPHPNFDVRYYVETYADVRQSGMNPLEHFICFGEAEGRSPNGGSEGDVYQTWIARYDTLDEDKRARMRQQQADWNHQPTVSIIVPVYEIAEIWLVKMIESVRRQVYPHWELCLADDASKSPHIRQTLTRYAAMDSRIKVVFREENGHISAASNSAIEVATGEWLGFLDHDDELSEHALFWVVEALNRHPEAGLVYSDEDKIDEQGQRSQPYFKCDWNPALLLNSNYICHFAVYRSELVRSVGGLRVGFEGSQDYDLVLRVTEQLQNHQIIHVPRILYHWRTLESSTAKQISAKNYALDAGLLALKEAMVRRSCGDAEVMIAPLHDCAYRVIYPIPPPPPLVSILIPTRNGLDLLARCIASIIDKTTYRSFEIIVVDNGSDDPAVLDYLHTLAERYPDQTLRVIRDDRPFNYSQLNNVAAQAAAGELLLLLNNDIEVIEADWLREMVSHALRPEIGVVGARLLYPDDRVQHVGVVMGVHDLAAHVLCGLPRSSHGYFSRDRLTQHYLVVTAACAMVRKAVFHQVGGLNEVELPVAFNDVDFCLRVHQAGYQNLFTPYAELYHHESATRGSDVENPEKIQRAQREIYYLKSTWKTKNFADPYYNPNLTLDGVTCALAFPPRLAAV